MELHFDVRAVPTGSWINPACTRAEKILAVQVMKDTRPFVPALTMSLNNRTRLIGSHIIYPGPYAQYLYYGKAMVDSKTGRGPFYIKGVGYRFRRGATLRATNRDLKFTKSVHPKAQAHWIEASLAANGAKWKRVARKAVAEYGNR